MFVEKSWAILLAVLLSSGAQSEKINQGLQNTLEDRLAILENDFKTAKQELYSEVHALKVENQDLKSAKATLEERVEYLEAITRNAVPRTCQDLKNLGVTKSGTYLVDPDGPGLGDAPISAMCDMATGKTIVLNDLEGQTVEVEHCEDPGCHSIIVNYDATARQLRALVDLSRECTQDFRYDCFVAPLVANGETNFAWWVGEDGQPNYYWDGSHDPSTHTCACGQDGSCINELYQCNCDSGYPQWLTDAGTITNMTSLPVTQLRFGGLAVDGQQATFGVGPLECSGRKDFRASESCESLRLAGHSSSGYYMVDGPNGMGYDLVLCDMEKETGDPGLETPTAIKLPEYQVSFGATDPKSASPGQVITYSRVLTNQGNAFDPETGTFVAPIDGVYSFSFFTLDKFDVQQSEFWLRVNGSQEGHTVNKGNGDGFSSTAMTLVLELSANDTVDTYLWIGGLHYQGTYHYTHFTGILLYPL